MILAYEVGGIVRVLADSSLFDVVELFSPNLLPFPRSVTQNQILDEENDSEEKHNPNDFDDVRYSKSSSLLVVGFLRMNSLDSLLYRHFLHFVHSSQI